MLTEKDYCDYETCVALREMGFTIDMTEKVYERNLMTNRYETIPKPLLYEAQKWLREEKGIIVYPVSIGDLQHQKWYAKIEYMDFYCYPIHDTYEDALVEGLREAIKMLKK